MSFSILEMSDNVLKRFEPIYSLRNIVRYNPRLRIKDESVAEHTAFVALLVIELYKDFKFNMEKALMMALLHDIAETQVSDVPHNVKRNFPKIAEALHDAELKALEDLGQFQARELLEEFEAYTTVESVIVNLADQISVQLYVNSEIALGNSTFLEIKNLVDDRVLVGFDKLRRLDVKR